MCSRRRASVRKYEHRRATAAVSPLLVLRQVSLSKTGQKRTPDCECPFFLQLTRNRFLYSALSLWSRARFWESITAIAAYRIRMTWERKVPAWCVSTGAVGSGCPSSLRERRELEGALPVKFKRRWELAAGVWTSSVPGWVPWSSSFFSME